MIYKIIIVLTASIDSVFAKFREKSYMKHLTFSVLSKLSILVDCYYYCCVIIYVLFTCFYPKQNKTYLENNGYKKKQYFLLKILENISNSGCLKGTFYKLKVTLIFLMFLYALLTTYEWMAYIVVCYLLNIKAELENWWVLVKSLVVAT